MTTEFDSMTDGELDDIGLYRCACGAIAVPLDSPTGRHCDLDPLPSLAPVRQ